MELIKSMFLVAGFLLSVRATFVIINSLNLTYNCGILIKNNYYFVKKDIDKRAKILLFALVVHVHWHLRSNPCTYSFEGGVAERSNATDCKSVDLVYDGSNPSPSTTVR